MTELPPSDDISQSKSKAKCGWIKFFNDNQIHRTIKYEEGKIVKDTIPFTPEGECKPGGLYFTNYENCGIWGREYGSNKVAYIELCPDSQVYTEPCGTKWKADKFKVVRIGCMWDDEEICLAAVKKNGFALEFVKTQIEEICLAAVKVNGRALKFVKNQTQAICLAALEQNGWVLKYVKNQTEELCLAAVKRSGMALELVKNQTEAICMAAVNKHAWALQSVQNQTEEICLAAVKRSGMALGFVKNQTEEICLAAVKQNGMALQTAKIKPKRFESQQQIKNFCG